MTAPQRSFLSPVAWLFVGYLLAVILFGAWVRISHSGDGCGANWPSCHGELLPSDPATSTRIEFTHRVTSALCGVFGVLLVGWSWRLHGRGPVTTAAGLTLLFIVLEGAIGAGLVLGELTGDNDSAARAVVIALHLGNTLALTAFAALTAWRSSRPMSFGFLPRRRAAFAAGLALFVVTAMTGAVTALGDTLFPQAVSDGGRLVARVLDGVSAGNHFLVRLRALHPAVAILAAVLLCLLLRPELRRNRWARATVGLVAGSVAIGAVNVALGAPGWVQLVHLAAAQATWIALILTCASLGPLGYDTGARPRR